MFGKHNTLGNNRETSVGEQTAEANNPWQETMANVKSFEEHMTSAESAEAEKAPLDLESLKDVAGFAEQLEEMGANQEILSNPAFERVLDRVLSESGLKFGAKLEGSSNSDNSELKLSCLRDKNRFLGSHQHDCSNFHIDVQKSGNFTIEYAYIDREQRTMNRDVFANSLAKLPPNAEIVDVYDDTNVAAQLKFVKHQNGSGFNLEIMDSYENQLSPTTDSENIGVGINTESNGISERCFDADGVETSRSDIEYQPKEINSHNVLFTFIKGWGASATPARASFNALGMFKQDRFSSFRKTKSATHYSRNPDGNTVKIEGYDRGGKFSSESVPLNTQYGNADIVVSNGVSIEDLRSASAE